MVFQPSLGGQFCYNILVRTLKYLSKGKARYG
jgi:hypothetical protein